MKKLLCSEVTLLEVRVFKSKLQRLFKGYTADLTFRGPCIVIYSYNESQRDVLFL
jgi:hypothetical protein